MAHRDRTGLVVIPPMLIEGVVAVWLLFHRPRGVHPLLPIVGIMAILGIWASTFFLQVPCHLRLQPAGTLKLSVFSSIRIGYEPSSGHSEWLFLSACYGSSG